jgi:hypothetical protein
MILPYYVSFLAPSNHSDALLIVLPVSSSLDLWAIFDGSFPQHIIFSSPTNSSGTIVYPLKLHNFVLVVE